MKRNRLFAILFLIVGVALNLSAQSIHPNDDKPSMMFIIPLSDNEPRHAKLSDIDGQSNPAFEPHEGLYFRIS